MDFDDEKARFEEAGRLAAKIRDESRRMIMPGEALLDVAETIEQMIAEEGARPAFPVNISINNIAAHYTPSLEDQSSFSNNDVVKIDIGVLVEGAIGDTAYTVDLSGKNEKMVEAADKALEAAIASMRPGVTVGTIGEVIETKVKEYGFKPISNLTGHMIKSGVLHAGIEIPNIKTTDPYELKEGDIFAVEPFVTNGRGYVGDSDQVEIFSLYYPGQIRMRQSRKVLQFVLENYSGLPFAERWLHKKFEAKLLVSASLREMLEHHVIKAYPILKEEEGAFVSQSEHTVIVEKNGARILTKP